MCIPVREPSYIFKFTQPGLIDLEHYLENESQIIDIALMNLTSYNPLNALFHP